MTKTVKIPLAALGLTGLLALAAPAQAQNYCREYQRNVVIGGVSHQAYGTACQGPDGQWRIADENLGQAPRPRPGRRRAARLLPGAGLLPARSGHRGR